MFDDIGGKIKGLAVAMSCIGIIVSIITAIAMFVEEAVGLGLVYLIIGPLLSWVGSFVVYGFGHLIETAENIEVQMYVRRDESSSYSLSKLTKENEVHDDSWICGVCGRKNKITASYCIGCGHKK